ncbi:hypothetical protein BOSEA1005_30507 [Hyphomicrobiales bacterium]|nr:hypothetical protein BOSEA1005_30507 [Hyphomicrobiales bacterium]
MGIRNLNSDFVPASLRRPVAVATSGVPRFWSAVYEVTSLAHLRNNTTRMHLHAIDAFYQHVEDIHGADVLDDILHQADADRLSTSLEGFFIKLRNSAVQTGSDHRDRWATVSSFVETIVKRVSEAEESHRSIHRRIQRLSARLSNLRPNPKAPNPSTIRALPSTVLREIYAIFDPASSNNPFRGESRRWRNHCLLLAFLHQGLRRGEALLLPADAIKSGIDDQTLKPRHWINVQNLFAEEDPRFCDAPSIKNDHSVRQVPVSPDVARRFQHFYENHRGKSPYPHFFSIPAEYHSAPEALVRSCRAHQARCLTLLDSISRTRCANQRSRLMTYGTHAPS